MASAVVQANAGRGVVARADCEWLVTNGLGGYGSGTVSGACTRRYHGLLIAALPAPLGRFVMLNHLAEELKLTDGRAFRLDSEDSESDSNGQNDSSLFEFFLESGLPAWHYDVDGIRLEKRILMPYLQNTVFVVYRVLSAPGKVRLRLRPSVHFRPHEAPVDGDFAQPYAVSAVHDRVEIRSDVTPPLRLRVVAPSSSLVLDGGKFFNARYLLERARGYDYEGRLWSPGYYRADLSQGESAALVASTEDWDTILAVEPNVAWNAEMQRRERLLHQARPEACHGMAAQLVLAADQFIIRPTTRVADAAVAHAAGDDVRTVIAGYHWFTDWGRDTMISLEGLTLVAGRPHEAGYLLRTFGRDVCEGLIPNLFPEGEREGVYHTADASLWYFHALGRYLRATKDRDTLVALLPTLKSIIDFHIRGTRFGIHVDPKDDLLTQGEQGYQLTWMDAKVGDWVVTPRRGKAVEINALWYNVLRLMERWLAEVGEHDEANQLAKRAERTHDSFNRRFWKEKGGYLYDVVDSEQGGPDDSFRPNQIMAVSLDHPVLVEQRWKQVVDAVAARLLTPVGLRSLAPGHADYKPTYDGDLRSRDAAYHQGTVWAWLIGPFIDATLRVYPNDLERAQSLLAGFELHMSEACVGSISEVFDAEPPFRPRGCIAQAWSVAEVLRCWVKTRTTNAPMPE